MTEEENDLEYQYQRVLDTQQARLKQVEQAIRVLRDYLNDEHAAVKPEIEAGLMELRDML